MNIPPTTAEDQVLIDAALARLDTLDPQFKARQKQALAAGYKDQVCAECRAVYLAFIDFVRCKSDTCPMKLRDKAGDAPNFIKMVIKGVPGASQ